MFDGNGDLRKIDAFMKETATPEQKRGMRSAILAQCFGSLAYLAFQHGQVVVYLLALGMNSAKVMLYISLLPVADWLRVPLAYYADRMGKKRTGTFGLILTVAGFAVMTMAGFFPLKLIDPVVVIGIILYSLGTVIAGCSWFALLSPVVPRNVRGRFLGTLRFSWQTVGVAFAALFGAFLAFDSSIRTYQLLFAMITAGLLARIVFYLKIPELEKPTSTSEGLRGSIVKVIGTAGLLPFCSYVFLLSFFTSACPIVFALMEKDVLAFADNQVVWLGNMVMVGSLLGYLIVGKAVDRRGTKPVFLICHFGYGIAIFLFLLRGLWPASVIYVIGALSFLFGLVRASSSVAITTELLALIPEENKSLAASVSETFQFGGAGLSGILCAWALRAGMLNESWTLWGMELSQYDTLLLGFGIMVIMLVVTLGLVPSVLRKHALTPGHN